MLIIGCGSIGRRHALSAASLKIDHAVVDSDGERAATVTAQSGASASFSRLSDALSWQPDATVVATPHALHIPHAVRALEVGSHVLIEKPISDSLEGLEEFQAVIKASGKSAFVVTNMRFHPAVRTLKDNLEAIGEVRYARAHYGNSLPLMRPDADYRTLYCARRATGGGVILDAIHEIDYLMWMLGKVDRVRCSHDRLSDLDIDVEDFASMVLEHESGARSVITMDYLRPFKRRGCEIIGADGILLWESEGKSPERCRVRLFEARTGAWRMLHESADMDTARPYVEMLESFTRAICGSQTDMLTATDAIGRLRVALTARDEQAEPPSC